MKSEDGEVDIDGEVVADLVGDYLFTDEAFIQNLSANRNVFQKQQDDSSTSAKRITQADLNKLLNSEISKTQKYVNSQFNSYIGLKTKDLYEFENIDEDVDSTNQVTPTDSTNTDTLSTVQTYQEVTHDDKKDANEETDNELQILEDELFNDE